MLVFRECRHKYSVSRIVLADCSMERQKRDYTISDLDKN